MDPLIIKSTPTTFGVVLDKQKSLFEFTGQSRPENVVAFFEPIFDWFNKYSLDPNEKTTVVFKLEYFNSSTAKVLLRFFVWLENFYNEGNNITINWYYNSPDEDMLESGEDFKSLVELPFEIKELTLNA